MGTQQKRWWRSSIRRNEHSSHQAVLIYVTLGMILLNLDLILWSAFKSAFKLLAWQILCMELPYPERKRVGITHYRSYHFTFCSQKPGASQWWGLSTRAQTRRSPVGFSEIQGTCSQYDTDRFKIVLYPSFCTAQQAQGDTRSSGPSWFLEKYIPDHSTTFLLSASLSKRYLSTAFYCFAFLQTSFNPGSAPPSQLFFSCSDKSRAILKGLKMLWKHGRRVTLLTAEGGCFLE